MLETFFLIVNEWIASGTTIAALGCFLWGIISNKPRDCRVALLLAMTKTAVIQRSHCGKAALPLFFYMASL